MIIYMRHATDDEANASKAHDAHLTEKGHRRSYEIVPSLISKYGYPDQIICSPYIRVKETIHEFRKALRKIDPQAFKKIKFKADRKLSRFFTREQQKKPDIRKDTKKYNVPIYETIEDFDIRIREHIMEMRRKNNYKNDEVIWIVSHGLWLKHCMRQLNVTCPESVKFLQVFPVSE